MRAMTGLRRLGVTVGYVGAALLVAAGCGQPTVVPAGSAGMEVPVEQVTQTATDTGSTPDRPAATDARAATSEPTKPASKASTPAAAKKPQPAAVAAQTPEKPRGVSARSKPAKGTAAVATEPAAVEAAAALPRTGTYTYALTGTSSLGPPPPTSTLTVADAGSGAQLWTLDARRDDGAGLVEELTLRTEPAGVYMAAYRLDASTGIAGVILEFAPNKPVLLTPTAGKPGMTWPFDLGTSGDGCSAAKGVGELLPGSASTHIFRLTTTVRTVGPASCVQIAGKRVQEITYPKASFLPTRIDSDLQGKVAGVPFKAATDATRSQSSDSAASTPHQDLAADRVRR